MQDQDPLAQLQPLRSPPDISWWPPAPGWWLLALCVLAVIATCIWLLWRRYQQRRYRRLALAKLNDLRDHAPSDTTSFSAACNQLLKAVALRAYPRQDVAALSGKAWRDFLNSSAGASNSSKEPLFSEDMLAQLYQVQTDIAKEGSEQHIEGLYRAAQYWIKHHRRPA